MIPPEHFPQLPSGPLFFAVLALIISVSSMPIVNVAFPAEPILMAAVLSSSDQLSIPTLLAVTTVASAIGDVVCYGLGRAFGPALLRLRIVRRARRHIAGAHRNVERRGSLAAMMLQRWIPPTRGLVPVVLGTKRQRFGHFVCYSVIACAAWASIMILGTRLGGPVLMMAIPTVLTMLLAIRAGRRLVTWRRQRRDRSHQHLTDTE
jgi:membrane protein DedA with SNARE-associated domain